MLLAEIESMSNTVVHLYTYPAVLTWKALMEIMK